MATTATIKMYNQINLGDCFLLNFSDGNQKSWLLIDFGSYTKGNDAREKEIAKHIVKTVGKDPLRIAVTHQHQDHLSGFVTAVKELGKLKGQVPEVWFSFLDDPDSPEGTAIRDVSTQYWNKNGKIKTLVAKNFKGTDDTAVKNMMEAKEGFDLFAEQQTGGQAISNLMDLADKPRFLSPGNVFDMPGMEGKVRVYVLGPPTDFNLLKSMDPKKGEAVQGLAALQSFDNTSSFLLDALQGIDDKQAKGKGIFNDFPFASKYARPINPKEQQITDKPTPNGTYTDNNFAWRRIDTDWLADVGRLALHMDNLTNNTSLVLAFEMVETGKVLLFVGDAQIGNWKSWFDVKFKDADKKDLDVTATDLLKRTVLYKAGHHSSHNATLRQGLDLMNEKELVIMVPLNQQVSNKFHFLMGKPAMLKGYNRKAQGRVVRTDTIYQADLPGMDPFKHPIDGISVDPSDADPTNKPQLYIEYKVS